MGTICGKGVVDKNFVELLVQNNFVHKNQQYHLIDVRNREECEAYPGIPGSINVPLSELSESFGQSSPAEFQSKYDMPKPAESSVLVLYCLKGPRAFKGSQLLRGLDWNCVTYKGSYVDWFGKGY